MAPDIIILGFPKCGTTSLMKYLEKEYDKIVTRREWCYKPFEEQLKLFKKEFGDPKDYKLAFITRNPAERMWSYYKSHSIPWEKNPNIDKVLEEVNYWHWIEMWNDYRPNVYNLEGLSTEPDFPHLNAGKEVDIPEEFKEYVTKGMKKFYGDF